MDYATAEHWLKDRGFLPISTRLPIVASGVRQEGGSS
jgi:hypothetical protein